MAPVCADSSGVLPLHTQRHHPSRWHAWRHDDNANNAADYTANDTADHTTDYTTDYTADYTAYDATDNTTDTTAAAICPAADGYDEPAADGPANYGTRAEYDGVAGIRVDRPRRSRAAKEETLAAE